MTSRILVVDDSPTQRKVLRDLLEAAGFEVDEAVDGIRGCAKVHNERFDGVVCDVNMPYMDGIKFIKLIRLQAKHENLPVLMLTSESGDEMMQRGKEAGVASWLVKPVPAETLLNAVRAMLEK